MPLITVVIPTYNRAPLVGEAIASVLAQDFADYELVVVDDGSTDNTGQVVKDVGGDRVRYLYQEQAGGPAARNRGAAAGDSPYLLLLDSDDTLLPGALAALAAEASHQPEVGLIGGGFFYADAAGALLGEARGWLSSERLDLARWVRDCPFIPSATLVRADWYHQVGGFDPALGASQDWDLYLRLAQAGCPMAWLRRPVARYRQHGGALTADVEKATRYALVALDRLYARPGLPAEVQAARGEAYALVYARCAARHYAAGRPATGQAALEAGRPYLPEAGGDERFVEMVLRNAARLQPPPDMTRLSHSLFDHLPPFLNQPGLRRRVEGRLAAADFFSAYRQRDWPAIRRAAGRAVATNPSWLANRGFLVIALRSLAHWK
jgi:alpha-1,6-rhamnosyltransferase